MITQRTTVNNCLFQSFIEGIGSIATLWNADVMEVCGRKIKCSSSLYSEVNILREDYQTIANDYKKVIQRIGNKAQSQS